MKSELYTPELEAHLDRLWEVGLHLHKLAEAGGSEELRFQDRVHRFEGKELRSVAIGFLLAYWSFYAWEYPGNTPEDEASNVIDFERELQKRRVD